MKKKSNSQGIFISVVTTAFAIWLFATGIPECAAVGVFVSMLAFFAWSDVFREIDEKINNSNSQSKTNNNE